MKIIVATDSAVQPVDTNGVPLFDVLEQYLSERPAPTQVSIDGVIVASETVAANRVKEGSLVRVMSARIASKGATGA